MKEYKVSRVSVMENGSRSMITCTKRFDSLEEALDAVNSLIERFPDFEAMPSGSLGRKMQWTKRVTLNGYKFAIVKGGSVFLMVTDLSGGLPMPIHLG